jgi:hypothetical protein
MGFGRSMDFEEPQFLDRGTTKFREHETTVTAKAPELIEYILVATLS